MSNWETKFYPVWVLGGIVLALWGCQTPAQYCIKIVHPWVQEFLSSTGAGVWRKAPMAFPDSSWGEAKVPPFLGVPPFSIKYPQDNFSLQNANWRPPKYNLARGDFWAFLYKNLQWSPKGWSSSVLINLSLRLIILSPIVSDRREAFGGRRWLERDVFVLKSYFESLWGRSLTDAATATISPKMGQEGPTFEGGFLTRVSSEKSSCP